MLQSEVEQSVQVEIERDSELFDALYSGPGIQYWVYREGEREPSGDAQILLYPVSELTESFNREAVQVELMSLGLSDSSLIADLNDFWPNGRDLSERALSERGRKGVGSELFEAILQDCRESGVDAVYVFTQSESMKAFLAKHDFFPFDSGRGNTFYRMIRKESAWSEMRLPEVA